MVKSVMPSVVQIITADSTGTGFVIDSSGLVATNEHVVGSASTVRIRFTDGRSYNSQVLGVDANADLALVQIRSQDTFTPAKLADSSNAAFGETVIAIGFPLGDLLGASPTITKGIISSIRPRSGVTHIQTDAAINPGNSGGPLFNETGLVIGVNVFIYREVDGLPIDGIAFAIAINELKSRTVALSRGQNTARPTPTPPPSRAGTSGDVRGSWFTAERIELNHDPDGYIKEYAIAENIRDFYVRATFSIPYSPQTGKSNSAIIFRSADANLSYIAIDQDGAWNFSIRADGETSVIDQGETHNWNSRQSDENSIAIMTVQNRLWLFANNRYVTDLDISEAESSGAISVATGIYQGTEIAGHSTIVTDIEMRKLTQLNRVPSETLQSGGEYIASHSADVDIAWGYATATFTLNAPASQWSAGIIFRDATDDTDILYTIDSYQEWAIYELTDNGEWPLLSYDSTRHIDVTHPVQNQIEVMFIGSVAILYVNGRTIGSVDITYPEQSGDVRAAFGLFLDDASVSASLENFYVYGFGN